MAVISPSGHCTYLADKDIYIYIYIYIYKCVCIFVNYSFIHSFIHSCIAHRNSMQLYKQIIKKYAGWSNSPTVQMFYVSYRMIIISLNYRYCNEYSTMPRIAQTRIGFRIMPCHAMAERSTAAAHSVYSHHTAFSYSLFTVVVMAAAVSLNQPQCVCLCLSEG